MEPKHREFAFLTGEKGAAIEIPDDLWERFHDPDQITGWQQKAFPKDKPKPKARPADGHLRDGEPVFFLCDSRAKAEENPQGLLFFGRAQMFRFPYPLSPRDLLPPEHRDPRLDMAEALFGRVGTEAGSEIEAVKGRVTFEDAVIQEAGRDAWFEEEMVPQILSAPNPTSYQLYLTQNGPAGPIALTTYFKKDTTTLRGHKLYWHRWQAEQGLKQVRAHPDNDEEYKKLLADLRSSEVKDTQHTLIKPVRDSKIFSGRLRFDNLTQVELGALLAALDLPNGCAHKIGMGKPLGLGSVRITPTLHLIVRKTRYSSWSGDGSERGDAGEMVKEFTTAILDHARTSGETLIPGAQGLCAIARLDALFHLLEWKNRPDRTKTEQMELDTFKKRRVLPGPHRLRSPKEPSWSGRLPQADGQPERRRVDPPQPPEPPEPKDEGTTRGPASPSSSGRELEGTLVKSGGLWAVALDGSDRVAALNSQRKVPPGAQKGQRVLVTPVGPSKKKLVVQMERLL